jgi:hypothetical protein
MYGTSFYEPDIRPAFLPPPFNYVPNIMQIHLRKTGAMQAMLTAVARGYHWHVGGQVPAERTAGLIAKFTERYELGLPWWTVARRRQAGLANARLFLHPAYNVPIFDWWLLLTDGAHPARTQERLADARERRQRLVFQTQFEAVRRPAPGGQPRWTWRIAQETYDDFAARIREAVRHRRDDRELKSLILAYHHLPGFRGVRNQVVALRQLTLDEWRRVRGDKECAFLPKAVQPFERFKAYHTVDWELVRDRLLAGQTPFAKDWRLGETPDGAEGGGRTAGPLRDADPALSG